MAALLELSHELLHCIFTEVEPVTLASLNLTCRDLHHYIKGNRLLHKDIYLQHYDEPRENETIDWERQMHDLTKMDRILESDDRESKLKHRAFVGAQVMAMISSASVDHDTSLNLQLLSDYFADTNNIDVLLCASSLFGRTESELQKPAETPELQQLSAKLHCMFGVPADQVPRPQTFDQSLSPSSCTRARTRPQMLHTFARSRVYDLRQYTDHTLWGPFMDDGRQSVDWEKVEAIMIVLGFNLNKFTERSDGRFAPVWTRPFVGATPGSYASHAAVPGPEKEEADNMLKIRELALSLDAQDPYGVTGTWMRVVCFLDYNDLYAFNFSQRIPDDEPREPIDTEEGIINLSEAVCMTLSG